MFSVQVKVGTIFYLEMEACYLLRIASYHCWSSETWKCIGLGYVPFVVLGGWWVSLHHPNSSANHWKHNADSTPSLLTMNHNLQNHPTCERISICLRKLPSWCDLNRKSPIENTPWNGQGTRTRIVLLVFIKILKSL